MIGRRIRLCGEHWDGCSSRVFNPLRERIARAPVILPIEEKSLSVQRIAATLRLQLYAAPSGARALCRYVAGDRFHCANAGLAYREPARSGPYRSRPILRTAFLGVFCMRFGDRARAEGETHT